MILTKNIFFRLFVFVCLFFFTIILGSFGFNKIIPGDYQPDSNDTIYDTVFIYELVYVYDTIYTEEIIVDTVHIYDTLDLDRKIDKKKITISQNLPKIHSIYNIKKQQINSSLFGSKIFADLIYSPLYTNSLFSSVDIYSEARQNNKYALSPLIGFSTGININYYNKKLTYSSGLLFSQIKEQFSYTATKDIIDTSYFYKYFTYPVSQIDTIWFINIDTLLFTGDTIYEAFLDTNYVYYMDSLYTSKLDSTEINYYDKYVNKYFYLELPLIFGYKINHIRFSIIPEIGLILGIILNSQGKIISLENIERTNDINKETQLSPVLFSLYTGVRFDYFLTKRIDFFTKIFYRQNLNSVFMDYPIIMKHRTFGIQFGFKYKF